MPAGQQAGLGVSSFVALVLRHHFIIFKVNRLKNRTSSFTVSHKNIGAVILQITYFIRKNTVFCGYRIGQKPVKTLDGRVRSKSCLVYIF